MMRWLATLLLVLALPALASGPSPRDFAHGLMLQAQTGKPLQELKLPDKVYAGVTRSDLGDLRVFNAEHVAVGYALCAPESAAQPRVRIRQLPVFILRATRNGHANGTRVRINTSRGTRIQVLEPMARSDDTVAKSGAAHGKGNIGAYVIDARGVGGAIQAVRVHWHAAGAGSEMHLRLQAGEDLQHWRTIVPDATLVQTHGKRGVLKSDRIGLPKDQYNYLRLESSDGRGLPRVERITAEFQQAAADVAPVLIRARANDKEQAVFTFDSKHLAPMYTAKVHLPMRNMSIVAALDSRPRPDASWQPRWQGEIYSVQGLERTRQWTPVRFAPTTDRYWRLRVLRGADSLAGQAPGLSLGYHSLYLRFLAQGDGPFLLAYGSARVVAAGQKCDRLLGAVPSKQLANITGTARITNVGADVGGEQALRPSPKPAQVQLYVLWAVLIFGALVLVGIALSLLRRVHRD